MINFILFVIIVMAIISFFTVCVYSYQSDKELIHAYFLEKCETVEVIARSSEYQFKNNTKLLSVLENMKWKGAVVNMSGPIQTYEFYQVKTNKTDEIQIIVTNSVIVGISGAVYLNH